MSWRKTIARREQRREREDRNLPPRLRQSWVFHPSSVVGLVAFLLAFLGLIISSVWREGDRTTFWIFLGMVAFAALFAYSLARTYRSKSRKELRGEPEADSVQWEDPQS